MIHVQCIICNNKELYIYVEKSSFKQGPFKQYLYNAAILMQLQIVLINVYNSLNIKWDDITITDFFPFFYFVLINLSCIRTTRTNKNN